MKNSIKTIPVTRLSGLFFILSLVMYMALGCNAGPPKNSRAAQALEGKAMFNEQCASCHGSDEVTVNKSLIDTLEMAPPDLKRIMKRRGVTQFPVAEVARIIDGRILVKSHGPREMPVWGKVYEESGMDETEIKGEKGKLIAYLMDIQKLD